MQSSSEKTARAIDSMNIGALVSRHLSIARPVLGNSYERGTPVSKAAGEGTNETGDTDSEKDTAHIQRQETFDRVCQLLRAKIGAEVYQSWFVRVQLEPSSDSVIRLSVPTLFYVRGSTVIILMTCWSFGKKRRHRF